MRERKINYDKYLKHFAKDAEEVATKYIRLYFAERYIADDVLITPENIDRVLNTSILKGVPMIYAAMERNGIVCKMNEDDASEGIQLAVSLLHDCAEKKVPQCLACGMILMYLDICMEIK